MYLKQINIFFFVLLISDIVTAVTFPTFECVHDMEDFLKYGWEEDTVGTLSYAADSTQLPEKFKNRPGLQSDDGIWYFDGLQNKWNLAVYRPVEYFEKEPITYIYIKYYAHVEIERDHVPRAYLLPAMLPSGAEIAEFQLSTDFKWKEAFFQIKMEGVIDESIYGLEIGTLYFQPNDFLFIDTINIVQGISISDVSDFMRYCPLNSAITTETTTESTTETTTESTTETTTESTTETTTESTTETTTESTTETTTDSTTETTTETTTDVITETTTESPPIHIPTTLECIQDQIHFEHYKWDSFLSHKYALNSYELPNMFQGKLIAFGIFYFEGTFKYPNQQIFKPISQLKNSTSTFLYIKYYVHSSSSNGDAGCQEQQAYIAPVISSDGNQFRLLNSTSSDMKWREEVVEIDTEIAQRIGIQVVLSSLGNGSFLFVDEIILVQGVPIKNQQDIVSLCRPAFHQRRTENINIIIDLSFNK